MSDRMDELVATARRAHIALNQLADIAREAEAERDALLAEHEAVMAMLPVCGVDAEEEGCDDTCDTCTVRGLLTAHHNAERVIRG